MKFDDNELMQIAAALAPALESLFTKYLGNPTQQPARPEPEFLSTKELCSLLNIKPQSVYGRVHRGELPSYKEPGSKKLKFRRTEILGMINRGRRGTTKEKADIAEAAQVAANGTHTQT